MSHQHAETEATRSTQSASHTFVQPKLVVGAVADPAEREADQIADRALAALRRSPAPVSTGESRIAPRDSEPSLAEQIASSGSRINRSAVVGSAGGDLDADTERRIQSAAGGGRSLPIGLQSSMGSAFGTDFSDVRLHVGAESDQLNERIQSRAFTLGNDVFVRRQDYAPRTGEGQRLIAHELAHTIQQGGAGVQRAPRQHVIRRNPSVASVVTAVRSKLDTSTGISGPKIWDPKEFKAATKTWGHQRGAAVKAVDGYLAKWKSTKSTDWEPLRKLAVQIRYACEQWILAHSVEDTQDGATRRGKNPVTNPIGNVVGKDWGGEETATGDWMIDPNRKKRFAGMVAMLDEANRMIIYLEKMINDDKDSRELLTDMEVSGETSDAHEKLKVKYEGDPSSTLAKLGALTEMAVPNAGDASEIEMAFRWPIDPSGIGFLGGTIRLKAQNSSPPGSSIGGQGSKNILARMEIVFTFGAQGMNVGKIQGEVGGYIEGSAKTGRECMILMSYALFRKFRESYVIPRSATNYLWGGGTGMFGASKAERWGKQVETDVFGQNEEGYVETGMLGGVSGDLSLGNDEIGGGIGGKVRGGSGTRYDKDSIKSVKGSLGATNKKRKETSFLTTQKQLGRGTRFFEFEFEGNVGPFKGAVGLRFQWQTAKALGADGKPVWDLKAAELEFKAGAKVPNVGGDELGERIAGWATEGVKTLVSKIRAVDGIKKDKQNAALTKQERKEAKVGSIQGETWTSVFDGLDQLRNVNGIETLANPGASPTTWMGGSASSSLANNASFGEAWGERSLGSTIGMEIALGGDLKGGEFMLSFNCEKAREFKIPMFLDITLKGTSRLIAFRLANGKWTIE